MAEKQKILVVDDSLVGLTVNLKLLEGINAEILTASSGKEAVIKALHTQFDLILMDVIMPDINGFESMEMIRRGERNKQTPFLFITALAGDELRTIQGLSLGAIDFIIKPVSKEILTIKVMNLLDLQKYRTSLEETAKELKEAIEEIQFLRDEAEMKAKKNYEIISRASLDGFATIDAKGRIIEANETYCRLTGYTRDEICSMHIADLEVAESKEAVLNHIKRIIDQGWDEFETLIKKRDGSIFPVGIGVRYDHENELIFLFLKDITTSKELEISERSLKENIVEKEKLIQELNNSLSKIKTLNSLIPICTCCKNIRNDSGYWEKVEDYLKSHTDSSFTHSLCPECTKKIYPDLCDKI